MMSAALHASDQTISYLLSLGASPNVTDVENRTALMDAIESRCVSTINLLAPVTKMNLEGALELLASSCIITDEVTTLVQRAAQEREVAVKGLFSASKFGSIAMIHRLAPHVGVVDQEVSKHCHAYQ